jgi:hypothetical protein
MPKLSRSKSVQSTVARLLLVAAVWVLALLLSAPSAFAVMRYVSPNGVDWWQSFQNWCSSAIASAGPYRSSVLLVHASQFKAVKDLVFIQETTSTGMPILRPSSRSARP